MKLMTSDTIRACILGLAVADALGVPVEFRSRRELDDDPVTGMRGFGSHPVPAGCWSDDTSMTLCALEAFTRKEFRRETVMDNFCAWLYRGEFTATGEVFDCGGTCAAAIRAYARHHADVESCGLADERSNGNGSLMRILPFALFAPEDLPFIEKASALTHAHPRSRIACGVYALILSELIEAREVGAYRAALEKAAARYGSDPEWRSFAPLAELESRSRDSIRSSGYVVDTLEAALWCLITTDSYRDCVLKAVNLGSDTDTVAAVAGGLAGAVYGPAGIPGEWLDALLRRDLIEELCEKAGARQGRFLLGPDDRFQRFSGIIRDALRGTPSDAEGD